MGRALDMTVDEYVSWPGLTSSEIQFVPVLARFFKDWSVPGGLYKPYCGSSKGFQSPKLNPFIKASRGGRGFVWVGVGVGDKDRLGRGGGGGCLGGPGGMSAGVGGDSVTTGDGDACSAAGAGGVPGAFWEQELDTSTAVSTHTRTSQKTLFIFALRILIQENAYN